MTVIRLKIRDDIAVIDTDKLMFAEARQIEKVTGMTLKQFTEASAEGSALAFQALVWTAWKRAKPGVLFNDLDEFGFDEIQVLDDDDNAMSAEELEAVGPTVAEPSGPADESL